MEGRKEEAWFVKHLVNVACDCLKTLASSESDFVTVWCNQLIKKPVPLLQRLAIYGVSISNSLDANARLNWLLEYVDLANEQCRFELFSVVGDSFPEADVETKSIFIKAIWDFLNPCSLPNTEVESKKQKCFDWLDWLNREDPECMEVSVAWAKVQRMEWFLYPKRYPPLPNWWNSVSETVINSRWTSTELSSKPSSEWFAELISFDWACIESAKTLEAVYCAAQRCFQWGIEFAKNLIENSDGESALWFGLINAWSDMELSQEEYLRSLLHIAKIELDPQFHAASAYFLHALFNRKSP